MGIIELPICYNFFGRAARVYKEQLEHRPAEGGPVSWRHPTRDGEGVQSQPWALRSRRHRSTGGESQGRCRGEHHRCRAASQPRRRPRFRGRGRQRGTAAGKETHHKRCVPRPLPPRKRTRGFSVCFCWFFSFCFLNALCCFRGGRRPPAPNAYSYS